MTKPKQGFWGLFNISFGFLGIQVAFGLQNANVSRIFQSLGSSVDDLAILWIAGPATGLLVQPIIGHFSDRTWGPLGRRRPYFLSGAILAALALVGMPHAHLLLFAAMLLWMLDASLNVSMEPFRAFVGDMVSAEERSAGYAVQTGFIGIGAVLGSLAPAAFTMLGIENTAPAGEIPPSVRAAFFAGAAAIFLAVLWTVLTTREYSPEQMRTFEGADAYDAKEVLVAPTNGLWWALAGAALLASVASLGLDKNLYVMGGGLLLFGLAQMLNRVLHTAGGKPSALTHILSDLAQMPQEMRKLAVVQFFSWLALFIMWIYTTPVVTQYAFGATDTASAAYNAGANWVGVMFSVYNGVAALAAFGLPVLVKRLGAARAHGLCLCIGGVSYASLLLIRDQALLLAPMVGVGIAWAAILTLPYVILAGTLPARKLGVYMGVFNFFIVIPQLLVATLMGTMIRTLFAGDALWTMLVAAIVMGMAALATLRVTNTR